MSSSEPSRDYDLLDRLVEEFNERFRNGERPSIKEYCDRHPSLAADLREMLPALAQVEGVKEPPLDEPTSSSPPITSLGDFRILREVGHGGMGVVYEAEQVSLGRRVALKVLTDRLMRDPKQKQRFEREAKAAAKLHHTNIVPVFGTGTHENTPYYVMQFIQGMGLDAVVEDLALIAPGTGTLAALPPTGPTPAPREVSQIARSMMTGEFRPSAEDEELIDAAPLSEQVGGLPTRSTDTSGVSSSVSLPGQSEATPGGKTRKLTYWQSVAKIGAQVADALDHAHKQGIIHRDIKPSNLLLDLTGTVWVTDFGLAKAEGADNLTHTGDVLGTLRYMPPEAFDGKADARGDLYSLGLTLYELAALRPAFDERERNRLIKQVTTGEPEPLGQVRRGVPRDLETVITKTIDRDPSRRYQSAAELRDDLQRFVDDEPIQARRQSQWERARRWCRHHPAVASLLGFIALLLLGVTAASVVAAAHFDQLARNEANAAGDERKARQEAEAAKLLAETNFARARAAVDDYFTKVSEEQLLQVPGLEDLRKELLLSALGFYQQFLKDRADDPSIRAGLADAHLRVARIQAELNPGAASRAYAEAQRYYRELLRTDPDNVEYQHGLAETFAGLRRFDDAVAIWSKLVRPELPRFQSELASAHSARATQFSASGRIPEALAAHEAAMALHERLVTLAPDNPQYRRDLAATLNNLGYLLERNRLSDEALLLYRRAIDHAREARTRAPYDPKTGRLLANLLGSAAATLRSSGDDDEAVKVYTEAVGVWEQLAFEHPNIPEFPSRLYALSLEVSRYQTQLGQKTEAEQSLFQARTALSRLPRTGAYNLFRLASIHALTADGIGKGRDQLTPAEEAERRKEADLALDFLEKAVDAGYSFPSQLAGNPDLAAIRDRDDFKELLAKVQVKANADREKYTEIARLQTAIQAAVTRSASATPEEKELAQKELIELRGKLVQILPHHNIKADQAASKQAFGLLQLERGNLDEAAQLLREAIVLREEIVQQQPTHPMYRADLISSQAALGQLHWVAGRRPEAVRAAEIGLAELDALIEKHPGHRDLLARWATESLSVAGKYLKLGLLDEAAAHYDRVFRKYQSADMIEWRFHALGRLLVGDAEGHRKVCEEFARRFPIEPDNPAAHYLTALWSMAPPAGPYDPETIRDYATAYLQKEPGSGWRRFYLGLTNYRLGRYEEALALVNHDWPLSLPVRAMIAHRLGRADEARRWLAEADARYRNEMRAGLLDPTRVFLRDIPNSEHDRLQFLILRNEARLLIEGKPAPVEELTSLYRARAYSLLGDAAKAEAAFAAVRPQPDDPELWELRGRVHVELGQHERAAADRVSARKAADALLAEKIPEEVVTGLAAYLDAAAVEPGWIPLRPASARSDVGDDLAIHPDGSVEPSGPLSGDNTYTLSVPTDLDGITALRLDVLSTGKAAGASGAVRLVELALSAAPLGGEAKPVVVARAVGVPKLATDAVPGSSWSATLDPDRGHSIVLFPEQPIDNKEGTSLTVRLRLHGPKDAALMGMFRLSVARVTSPTLKALESPNAAAEVAPRVSGRFVRIELPGSKRVLCLAEVEVISGGRNVARTGRATQASTSTQHQAVASRAIDGNKSGDFFAYGQTLTNEQANPWWEVDLRSEYPIDQVRIYNRTEQGGRYVLRLAGYTLRVLDAKRKDVFTRTNQPAPLVLATHELRPDPFALPDVEAAPELVRVPAGAIRDRLAIGATLARRGRLSAAADLFGRAIAASVKPEAAWPVYRHAMTYDAVFSELARLRPDDLELWLARGRYLMEKGRNEEADEAFAVAAKRTPKELHRFLDGGWWVAGPYPNTLDVPCPPEKLADPSKPVAVVSGRSDHAWQPVPFTRADGRLDLEGVLNFEPPQSAYALACIYSPEERVTTLNVVGRGPIRAWWNGQMVFSDTVARSMAWDSWTTATPVTLRKGRNQVLIRASGTESLNPWFWCRLGDHPADVGINLARAGLWTEAEAAYAEACRRVDDPEHLGRTYAHLLWVNGKKEEARAELDRLLREHATTNRWTVARGILGIAVLFPETRPEYARLADVVEAERNRRADRAGWLLNETGLGYLAAGKWEVAARLLEESRQQNDGARIWPSLALVYHHLGQRDKAVELVNKAEEWIARKLAEQLERPNLHLPWWGTDTIQFFGLLDRARAELKIKPNPTIDFAAVQRRYRKQLAELDPATEPHDYHLLRFPRDPLKWVALGRRRGELGRWDDARKAFDTATKLAPEDPQVWKARAQAYAALGKWDEAAADFVQAIERVPANQVNYWQDPAGVHSAAVIEDEVFAHVVKVLPKDSALQATRFRSFVEKGDWQRAAMTLDAARDTTFGKYFESGSWRATLAAYLGDEVGYRKQCEDLLKRATGTNDLWVSCHTASACLLKPDGVTDIKAILPLAERVVTGTDKSPQRPRLIRLRALAAYRAGDPAGAVTWLLRTPEQGSSRHALVWQAIRALAEHRLGRAPQARAWLDKARASLADRPQLERHQMFDSGGIHWLEGELLLREAEQLIDANWGQERRP